jgi:hypothetical protein
MNVIMARRSRYEIVECVITGHASYGLIVRSRSGEPGYVERDMIADWPTRAEDWPAAGKAILAVVLGYAHDGRLHLSAQPSYVAYVQSARDIHSVQQAWARLHGADREYVESKESLYSSGDAHVVLRWALRQAPRSSQPGVALRALAGGPSGLVLDLMSELMQMVIDDNHLDEVRGVIMSVGIKVAAPALQRSVESLLDAANLGVEQYLRLAELLSRLGAARSLDTVTESMLESERASVREAGRRFQDERRT